MRRIALWFLSTAAVVALLFGYDTSTSGPEPAASETVVAAPAAPESSGTGSSASESSGTGSSGGSAGTESSGSGSSGSSTATTVAGSVVSTRWGDVQVTITVTDGKITAVDVPEYPTANGKDRQINAYALPILKQETLSAESADIDMVSGATVTSEGYVESLQSALDQAGS